MEIRTRIAPSPTGNLHIGTARTALFNYAFARAKQGKFIVRIEDTDLERSDKKFEEDIVTSLEWLGLTWDEFYRQSERIETYKKYAEKLLADGKAFYCPHSEEELEVERKTQMERREAPRHVCALREGGGKTGIIRLKNDRQGAITFEDVVHGRISFDAASLGDFSLAKNISAPLYNFAVVVDDEEMRISHVIRGEDHIPNTPKQILIQETLGFRSPRWAHLPLILDKNRAKLSKRAGAESIREYKEMGYLSGAMINFPILLGWHPQDNREIFSLDEIIKEFSLERAQKGGAIFDVEKLNWINREHLKMKTPEELAVLLKDYFKPAWAASGLDLEKIAVLARERVSKLADAAEEIKFFFEMPEYPKEMLFWKGEGESGKIAERLGKLENIIMALPDSFSAKEIEAAVMPYAERGGRGEVLWPFRVSLSGREKSPGPFEIAEILGKEHTLARVRHAKAILS